MEISITFDSAQVDDAFAIAELISVGRRDAYTLDPPSYDQMVTQQMAPGAVAELAANISSATADEKFYQVARSAGGKVVGVVIGERDEEHGDKLSRLFIAPECQGQGLGSTLLANFLAWSPSGHQMLAVGRGNTTAIKFYEKAGFQRTDKTKVWRGIDFVFMTRDDEKGEKL